MTLYPHNVIARGFASTKQWRMCGLQARAMSRSSLFWPASCLVPMTVILTLCLAKYVEFQLP